MTNLIQEAINHIDSEAEKSPNPTAKRIAQYIIDKCISNDIAAAKILDKTKSLNKCLNDIMSKAKKEAVNNCAYVEDTIVYSWVRGYYGLAETCEQKSTSSVFNGPSLLDLM